VLGIIAAASTRLLRIGSLIGAKIKNHRRQAQAQAGHYIVTTYEWEISEDADG
jgi:hypothetical protein